MGARVPHHLGSHPVRKIDRIILQPRERVALVMLQRRVLGFAHPLVLLATKRLELPPDATEVIAGWRRHDPCSFPPASACRPPPAHRPGLYIINEVQDLCPKQPAR